VPNCGLRPVPVGQAHLSSGARRRDVAPPHLYILLERYLVEMDFLKSAVASAISKGPAFGYSFGDRVDLNDSIWTLHNGTKRVWPGCLHISGAVPANMNLLGRRLKV
jgi:hypothetical protein